MGLAHYIFGQKSRHRALRREMVADRWRVGPRAGRGVEICAPEAGARQGWGGMKTMELPRSSKYHKQMVKVLKI